MRFFFSNVKIKIIKRLTSSRASRMHMQTQIQIHRDTFKYRVQRHRIYPTQLSNYCFRYCRITAR